MKLDPTKIQHGVLALSVALLSACGGIPRYAFTANQSDNSVSTYVVDASTGRLKYIGKVEAGVEPISVTLDPSGKHAYVANFGANTISQYTLGLNGTLTPNTTVATVVAGIKPLSVTVDPSGKFAYVANWGNGNTSTVSQYTIGKDGTLIPNATAATVAAGVYSESVIIDPSGKFAYVANYGDGKNAGTVSQFFVGTDGVLVPNTIAASVSAGVAPVSVTVDPLGKFVYVANLGNGFTASTVSQYTIGTNGALTPNTAAATVPAGIKPVIVTVDPSGKFAYVANRGIRSNAGTVSQYTIGMNGALTPNTSAATVAAGSFPYSVTVDPSGRFVYVANNGDDSISQYTIGTNGGLTPLSPATVAGAAGPASIVVSAGAAAVKAVSRYAYGVNCETISQYTIGTNGALTPTAETNGTGQCPCSIAIDPSGKFAYVANSGDGDIVGTVSQYTIGMDGTLTPNASAATVTAGILHPSYITVDPSGKFAYVVNKENGYHDPTVSQYTIGSNGALTPNTVAASFVAGEGPISVAVDPSGKFAYVVNSNYVSQYVIGRNGALTPNATAATVNAGNPSSLAIDPSGKFAYVASWDGVSQFTIGTNGELARNSPATVALGVRPNRVTIDPSGKFAYVTSQDMFDSTSSVRQYLIGKDGVLMPNNPKTVVTGLLPDSVAIDTSGKFAYVPNADDISQYIIGTNGALESLSATMAVDASEPAVRQYVYVAAAPQNTISQYIIGSNGALTPNASASKIDAGEAPVSVTVVPSGKFAYVASGGNTSTILQYTVGSNGVLTPNTSAKILTVDASPSPVTVDPLGKFAYVPNGRGNTVLQYTIGANGVLNPNFNAATVPAGDNPVSVTVDPFGKFAYVANKGDRENASTVSQYTIGNDGALTPNTTAATVAAGVGPESVAVDSSGKYAYVANCDDNTVSQYIIRPDGALMPNASAATVRAGIRPTYIIVDPSGEFVYVANMGRFCLGDWACDNSAATISQYTIGRAGALSPNSTAAIVKTGESPKSITFDRSGKYAYVLHYGGTVSQYAIGTNGALTPNTIAAKVGTRKKFFSFITAGTWR